MGSAVAAVASYAAVSFVVLTAYNVWLLRLIKVGLAGTLAYALRELAGYFLICFAVKYAFLQTGIASPLASAVAAAPLVGLLALWRLRAHPGLRTLWQP